MIPKYSTTRLFFSSLLFSIQYRNDMIRYETTQLNTKSYDRTPTQCVYRKYVRTKCLRPYPYPILCCPYSSTFETVLDIFDTYTTQRNVIQHTTIQRSTIRYNTTQHNTTQHKTILSTNDRLPHRTVPQCTTADCSSIPFSVAPQHTPTELR
jgi:hypothetical protein